MLFRTWPLPINLEAVELTHLWVLDDGSRNGHTLLLAPGQQNSTTANLQHTNSLVGGNVQEPAA